MIVFVAVYLLVCLVAWLRLVCLVLVVLFFDLLFSGCVSRCLGLLGLVVWCFG